jgi:hypothetical protein
MANERDAGRPPKAQEMRVQYFELAKEGAELLKRRAELNLSVDGISQKLTGLYRELDKIGATAGMDPEPF